MSASTPPVARVAAVRKTYGRTVAVDEVSFDVADGEIFGRRYGATGLGRPSALARSQLAW